VLHHLTAAQDAAVVLEDVKHGLVVVT